MLTLKRLMKMITIPSYKILMVNKDGTNLLHKYKMILKNWKLDATTLYMGKFMRCLKLILI